MDGIWIVFGRGSNDTVSPEPKSPDPSGNIGVMETTDVLLNSLLGAIVEGVTLVGELASFLKEKVYIG